MGYNFGTTMLVALQSVGTSAILAFAGFYMHKRGFILDGFSKKTMALLSKEVTIPMLLFTQLVKCVPDSADPTKCSTITNEISQGLWIVLIWPIFVVSCGLAIGYLVAVVTRSRQKRVVIGAIAFGNSTALPITLSAAIVASLPPSSAIALTDPILLVGLYQILYPMFQWGVGSFLFPPSTNTKEETPEVGITVELGANEIASPNQQEKAQTKARSLMKKVHLILSKFLQPPVIAALSGLIVTAIPQLRGLLVNLTPKDEMTVPFGWLFNGLNTIAGAAVPINMVILGINLSMAAGDFTFFQRCRRKSRVTDDFSIASLSSDNNESPVGMVTAIESGEHESLGHEDKNEDESSKMSYWTMVAVIFGKMVLMPAIGVLSVLGLQQIMVVPDDVAATMYMVMMLVFITPTANNIMVLVELSNGDASKKEMATLIACQYAAAPILLSLSVAVVVFVASS